MYFLSIFWISGSYSITFYISGVSGLSLIYYHHQVFLEPSFWNSWVLILDFKNLFFYYLKSCISGLPRLIYIVSYHFYFTIYFLYFWSINSYFSWINFYLKFLFSLRNSIFKHIKILISFFVFLDHFHLLQPVFYHFQFSIFLVYFP